MVKLVPPNGVIVDALESLKVPFVNVSVGDEVAVAMVITAVTSSVFALLVPMLRVILLNVVVPDPLTVAFPFLLKTKSTGTFAPCAERVPLFVKFPPALIVHV